MGLVGVCCYDSIGRLLSKLDSNNKVLQVYHYAASTFRAHG
jgi:hypothetical protein